MATQSKIIGLLAAATLAFASLGDARAETAKQCGLRTEILKQLAGGFQERPVAGGMAGGGAALFEVLASPDGATWTLLYSMPSGVSCLIATGEDWRQMPVAEALGPST